MAGKIYYLPPVDYTKGKVFGKKYNFVAVYRKSHQYPRGCAVAGMRDTENHPYTANELEIRQRFKAVVVSTRQRMQDPTKIAQDTAAFKSQTTYRTLYQYVFNQEWADYQA